MTAMKSYYIWDRLECRIVGKTYRDLKSIRRRVDALDNHYGAYRYSVRQLLG